VVVPSLDCTSAVNPFAQSRLDALYSSHGDYVRQYTKATNELYKGGFILKEDANKLIAGAQSRPIP
jgi:hypothetical protein